MPFNHQTKARFFLTLVRFSEELRFVMCEKVFLSWPVWHLSCFTIFLLNCFISQLIFLLFWNDLSKPLFYQLHVFLCTQSFSLPMIYFQVRGSEVLVQRVLLKRAQRNQVNEKKKSVVCEYGQCPFCLIWSFIEILRISWNRDNTRNFGHPHPHFHFVALLKDWQSDLTFLLLEWQQENRTGSMSTVVFVVQTKDAFGNITQRRGSLLSYQPTRWSRQKVGL